MLNKEKERDGFIPENRIDAPIFKALFGWLCEATASLLYCWWTKYLYRPTGIQSVGMAFADNTYSCAGATQFAGLSGGSGQ
jgi:hypothetical protein